VVVEMSVVVATWNRADRLPRLVGALAEQVGAPPFELVVVDDGSTDRTPEVLSELAASAPFPLRTVRLEQNRGPAAARNAGWQAAAAAVVAFTDDDCWPSPGWLAALAGAIEEADVVQGATVPDPDAVGRDWFSHTIEVLSERGHYETCNIAYRRRWLEAAGGFDEGFRARGAGGPIYGEDTDLAWRVKDLGATTAFSEAAVVTHEVRPGTLLDRLRSLRRREGVVMVVRRHPEVRASFPGGWWYQPEHGPVLLAVAGMALAATDLRSPLRWALAGAAAAPYLRVRTRGLSLRYALGMLPRMFAFDLGEVAVLAWASAKHRTLVL
jgi:glycosyltransferase involved in cell wall biosynthesis